LDMDETKLYSGGKEELERWGEDSGVKVIY
jgi:hypothetical protein